MPITRRAFFRDAVLGACTLPGLISSFELGRAADFERIDEIVFDARRSAALEFAETAAGLGARTRAIRGDLVERCFEDLCVRWRTRRVPIAGLTDFRSLFLLQAMAADVGLHPVLRIHHGIRAGTVIHEAFGAQAHRAITDEYFAQCGERWACEAARLVFELPWNLAGKARRSGNLGEANADTLGSRALVTWVLA